MLVREKIKIFTGDEENSLEKKINTWIDESPIKIVRCLQSEAIASTSEGYCRHLTISIFYEEEVM